MSFASIRIGTTRATTTRTRTPPIVKPSIQPKLLTIFASSDRLAEVPDGLQARVDRGEPFRHGAGQVGYGGDAAGDLAERGLDGPQVKDDPQQADGGDADNQRGDDQGAPGGSWHGWRSFLRFGWQ